MPKTVRVLIKRLRIEKKPIRRPHYVPTTATRPSVIHLLAVSTYLSPVRLDRASGAAVTNYRG
jgi:hypothetical protein